jgi:hypothetical protein
LDLVGFDIRKFKETNAAIVHNTYEPADKFPKMIWPTNYYKLAAATMFTLFFAGKDFAPKCIVENGKMVIISEDAGSSSKSKVNIQDFLQSHYCNSIKILVEQLKKEGLLDCVVCGYDTLNEPSGGYLGWSDITQFTIHQELKHGLTPTALQSMLLGEGIKCDVEYWDFGMLGPKKVGTQIVNEEGVRCWKDGYQCIWLSHGVYDKSGQALIPNYFASAPGEGGKPLDWISYYWKPFIRRYTQTIRDVHSKAIIFVEPPVNEIPPVWEPEAGDPVDRICYTPHWYDGVTLMNKHFSPWWTIDYIGYKRGMYSNILSALSFGYKGIKNNFSKQLGMIRDEGLGYIGDTPCLIGEIGIPFDMDNKKAYSDGDYKQQRLAMDANMTALDRNMLNFTLWNYCSDNNHKWGDNWNGEDLSLVSSSNTTLPRKKMRREKTVDTAYTDDSGIGSIRSTESLEEKHVRSKTMPTSSELNEGARALLAFLRPYPRKTAGVPVMMSFDCESKKKTFKFRYTSSTVFTSNVVGEGTEIFLPRLHYGLPAQSLKDVTEVSKDSKFFAIEDLQKKHLEETPVFFYVKVSSGNWTYDSVNQTLHFFHGNGVEHEITVTVSSKSYPGSKPSNGLNLCNIL